MPRRMGNLLAAALLLAAPPALGFEGYVTQDTTWATDITITGHVIVLGGATLTIAPGVTVTFTGPYWLQTEEFLQGCIVAQQCVFTATAPGPGTWRGIALRGSGAGRIEGCEIKYASEGCLLVRAWESAVVDCHIHHNVTGISSTDGLLLRDDLRRRSARGERVAGCLIEDNQVGLSTNWGYGGFYEDNQLIGNAQAGMRFGDYCHAAVYRNTITGNGIGIHVTAWGLGEVDPLIGGSAENANQIHSNAAYAVQVDPPQYVGQPAVISAQYNDWGPETTLEMIIEGYPSDIEAICDCWEDPQCQCVDYQNWILAPQAAGRPDGAGEELVASPNPFCDLVQIRLVPPSLEGQANLTIFDATGRAVRELWEGEAGHLGASLVWDGRDGVGLPVPGGLYFCRLQAAGAERTLRLLRLE